MDQEQPPLDLNRRRLARELEGELGGLFGIEARDIEAAIERLWQAIDSGEFQQRYATARIPPWMQRTIVALDSVYAMAEQAATDGEVELLEQIRQVVASYQQRLGRLTAGQAPE
ncbi:MAG: hypothetical protein K1X75_09170 [Leptospirales bacterium]|nr:hypothetical protein [Leptospirales bacterium]